MKTVVILNAPPFSGKDTIADLMVKHLGAIKQEFKASLYEAFATHFNLPLSYVLKICTDRKYKDTAVSTFSLDNGMTPRAGLIHVSEDIYKVRYGADYFGEQAAEKLVEGLNVFSDGGGWWGELTPVAQEADKVIVCRLYREGYDFGKDSRSYYDEAKVPVVICNKIAICNVNLIENNPIAALDTIGVHIL